MGRTSSVRESVELEARDAVRWCDLRCRDGIGVKRSFELQREDSESDRSPDVRRSFEDSSVRSELACARGPRRIRVVGRILSLSDGVGAVTITLVGAVIITLT